MSLRVPFVPTPQPVVRKMLELAGASANDVVYDLGCGDGRIVITAVKEFNVKKAVCVELRDDLIEALKITIEQEGLTDRIEIRHQDMFETDLSDATIITLFLLTSVNDELAPKFERELKPGARIVSHEFKITRWLPLVSATVYDGHVSHNIYLYVHGYSNRA